MVLTWSEQLSIGNAILDADHRELLELIRDIDRATEAKDCFALSQALKQFGVCMERHFLNKELFAHALGIPFTEHQLEYENMLAAVDIMRREIGQNAEENVSIMERCAHFLQDWLIKHINEQDLWMKPILQTCTYDFKVEGVFV